MRLILTYHSLNASGWCYHDNDHIALWNDLCLLAHLNYTVLPLQTFVDAIHGHCISSLPPDSVALTCDDGPDHDYLDFYHPQAGLLPSFKSIVEQARRSGQSASMTSFVIANPHAREQLDKACIAGRNQWNDSWWKEATQDDSWSIACHSWDHNHPSVVPRITPNVEPGKFCNIDTPQMADLQIKEAMELIQATTNGEAKQWLAFPYGESNDFLREVYLPSCGCVSAAFTTEGAYLDDETHQFEIPRFVCGEHWSSPAGLVKLLTGESK